MAEIKAPLLEDADVRVASTIDAESAAKKTSSPSRSIRYLAGSAVCLSFLALYATGSYYRKTIVPSQFTSLAEGWGEAKCYKNTGGTCYMFGCNAERHSVCSMGRCYCESGCVGADGTCRKDITQYELVASNFRLRNSWWKDQYLYAPRTVFMEQLRVTEYKGKYADLWNLYKVPGPMWVPGPNGSALTLGHLERQTAYILSPVEYPEFAAGIANTKMELLIPGDKNNNRPDIVVPVGSLFVVDLYHLASRHLLANSAPFDPSRVLNVLCRPKKNPSAIEINGMYGQASWYAHSGSWEVFGWVWSDPKEGGYWEAEPPLDIELPECN